MSYGTISNEWLNKNNLETLWAAIVRDFVHAGANPVSGGDGGTTKGAIPYWGANSTPTGTGQPIQPSHLQIGSVGQFIGVSSNGIPEWTTPQILQAGGSSSTALTLYLKDAPTVALTLQVADETQWGILTDGTQTLGGDKTFAGHVHGNKNIEASWGMSANGIADLAFGESGGGGTVTRLVLCGTAYEPEGGVITVPASSLRTGLGLGMAAYKNIGVVTSGDMNLVTGDAVNSAINSALTAAMKIEGETTTDVITNPNANPVTIDGQSVSAYKGMVVFYSSKEFVWTGSSWKELGDEGSFALKTITITGTGYLGGGGDLSVNRSLDLTDTAKGYIAEGRNAYGYFTGGILDAAHMSAANIVTALGITPVNRAIADKDGNDITTHYAVASTTAASIGQLYVMATDNYDSIQLIDGRLYDIEPYVYEMMQVARPDVDNSELNIIGSLNASRNIHASWGVSANGIADLAFGGGGGGGTITQIQIDGVPQEDVDGIVNLPAYPNIEGLASQTWVTAEITALNLGTASTHAHTNYVTGITWDSSTRKLKQSKGDGAATDIVQFGTAYSHDHDEYVTVIAANGDDLSITKGSENPVLLTVPYATLSTDTKTELQSSQEFIYRQTGGGTLTKPYSSGVIKRILGNSVVWNQLVETPTTSGSNTTTDTRGEFMADIWSINSSGQEVSRLHTVGLYQTSQTKFLVSDIVTLSGTNAVGLYFKHDGSVRNIGIFNKIGLINGHVYYLSCFINSCDVSTVGGLSWGTHQIVDLTRFFNGNIPTGLTAETFERDYGYLLANPAYNEGQLINNSAEGLETVGFNIWDEEWRNGGYNPSDGTYYTHPSYVSNKNPIKVLPETNYYIKSPVAAYVFYYDANMHYISGGQLNYRTFQTPANAYYINFTDISVSTYSNDICINLSNTAKNGTYEPYKRNVLELHLEEIKVKSHNIWDEEIKLGYYSTDGSWNAVASGSHISSKNKIPVFPDKTYYIKADYSNTRIIYYDIEGNFMSYLNNNRAPFTTPANCHYIDFSVWTYGSTTYNNDICINESSSFNGQYEPHGILTINGLKQAGSVRDERVGNKFIQRVGHKKVVANDIAFYGTSGGSSVKRAYTNGNYIVDAKTSTMGDEIKGINTLGYRLANFDGYWIQDKTIGIRVGVLTIGDNDKSSLEQFKAMCPFELNYELATPIEYELIDDFPTTYPIDVLGTERIVSDELVAPFVADIQYGAEQRDIAVDINNVFTGLTSRIDAMDISHYQSSQTSAVDTHVITINGKKFYLKFNVTEADSSVSPQIMPAFDLEVSDTDDNTGNVQSFSFGTMSESEITSICHL